MSEATASAPAKPTGIHWKGNGWYAARTVRGIEIYYYLGPRKSLPLEEERGKASGYGMGEPVHITTKEGFTYVY